MKTLLLAVILMTGCATAPTPQQLQQYSNLAHQTAQNAIEDYKTIKPLIQH